MLQESDDPLEYFVAFLTVDILTTVIAETNHVKAVSWLNQWVDMTLNELKTFIALLP